MIIDTGILKRSFAQAQQKVALSAFRRWPMPLHVSGLVKHCLTIRQDRLRVIKTHKREVQRTETK